MGIPSASGTTQHSYPTSASQAIRIVPIRIRLILGFLTVFLAMGGMTYRFMSESSNVQRHLSMINDVNSVKQRYAINFRGSVHDRAISLRDVVLAKDLNQASIYLDEIKILTQKYADSAGPLDQLLAQTDSNAEEHAILKDIKAIEAQTLPLIQKVIDLRLSGADREAHDLLMAQAKPAFTQWLKDINRFIDHEEAKNKVEGEIIRSILNRGTRIGLLSLLIAGIAAIAAAIWITLALKPLRNLSDIMKRMSQGDYELDVPHYLCRDELGLISDATIIFKENGKKMQEMQRQQEALERKTEEEKKAAALKLADDFEQSVKTIVSQLSTAASTLSQNAEGLVKNAADTKEKANNALGEASNTTSNVQSSASSADELSGTVKAISAQLEKTTLMIQDSGEKARNADNVATDRKSVV